MFCLCVRSVIRGVRLWRRRRRVWKQRLRRWKVGWGPFFSPLAFSSLISHTNFSWLTSGICLAVLVPVDPRTLSTHLAPCSLFHPPSRGARCWLAFVLKRVGVLLKKVAYYVATVRESTHRTSSEVTRKVMSRLTVLAGQRERVHGSFPEGTRILDPLGRCGCFLTCFALNETRRRRLLVSCTLNFRKPRGLVSCFVFRTALPINFVVAHNTPRNLGSVFFNGIKHTDKLVAPQYNHHPLTLRSRIRSGVITLLRSVSLSRLSPKRCNCRALADSRGAAATGKEGGMTTVVVGKNVELVHV